MAHFYGEVKGQAKTAATRRGSSNGGLEAHIRGWNLGIRVVLKQENGKDVAYVYKTAGSNGNRFGTLLHIEKEQ